MTQEVHSLVGAYALDALSDIERRRFERHVADCETCELELRGLRETTGRLGAAVAQEPPPGLRDRVFAEIANVRQLPPAGADSDTDTDTDTDADAGLGLDTAFDAGSDLRRRRDGARWGRRGQWILSGAAAACLAIAIALGVTTVRTQQRVEQVEATNRELTRVLSAPDARAINRPVTGGGAGTVVVSKQQGKAVVIMSGLAAPPPAKAYELWLMGPGEPRAVGLMRPKGPDDAPSPVTVGPLGDSTEVGITVEPVGGSPAPTSAPVFTVRLPV